MNEKTLRILALALQINAMYENSNTYTVCFEMMHNMPQGFEMCVNIWHKTEINLYRAYIFSFWDKPSDVDKWIQACTFELEAILAEIAPITRFFNRK